MKIATVIPARADGTVIFQRSGRTYVFRRESGGALACNVDEKEDVRAMLAADNFYPLQQEDEPLAQKIVQEAAEAAPRPARTRRAKKDEGASA